MKASHSSIKLENIIKYFFKVSNNRYIHSPFYEFLQKITLRKIPYTYTENPVPVMKTGNPCAHILTGKTCFNHRENL